MNQQIPSFKKIHLWVSPFFLTTKIDKNVENSTNLSFVSSVRSLKLSKGANYSRIFALKKKLIKRNGFLKTQRDVFIWNQTPNKNMEIFLPEFARNPRKVKELLQSWKTPQVPKISLLVFQWLSELRLSLVTGDQSNVQRRRMAGFSKQSV